MFCLVYKSKAISGLTLAEIKKLLEKARLYNSANNISGCLVYHEGEFLQYIEGNQVKVLKLFDKISLDKRHTDVQLLSHGTIENREFKSWSMAYKNTNGENDHLQYITLLMEAYMEQDFKIQEPNPASKKFWNTTKSLLEKDKSFNIL